MSTLKNSRVNQRLVLTLAAGVICGFLSACLLITATRDMSHVLYWFPKNSHRDPHHYSQLELEVRKSYIIVDFDISDINK